MKLRRWSVAIFACWLSLEGAAGSYTLSPDSTSHTDSIRAGSGTVVSDPSDTYSVEVPSGQMATVTIKVLPGGSLKYCTQGGFTVFKNGSMQSSATTPMTFTSNGTISLSAWASDPTIQDTSIWFDRWNIAHYRYVYYTTYWYEANYSITATYDRLIPDLMVGQLTSDSGLVVQRGKAIVFRFVISNNGGASSVATTAGLRHNGLLLKSFAVPALSSGKSETFTYELPAGISSDGEHEFSVSVTPVGEDRDASNDTKSLTISTPRLSLERYSVEVSADENVGNSVKVSGNADSFASCGVASRGWLAVDESLLSSGEVQFGVTRNSSSVDRLGVITVTNVFGQSCQLTVRQKGMTIPDSPVVSARQQDATLDVLVRYNAVSRALKYSILRAEGSVNGTYKTIATIEGLSYTDADVVAGRTYYYKIVARNEAGNTESEATRCAVMPVLAKPTLTSSTLFFDRVLVGYTHVTPGVTIRYTEDGSEPTDNSAVFPAAGLTVTDSQAIRARAFKHGYMFSPVDEAEYMRVTIPAVPLNLRVSSSVLTWKAVEGAQYYTVYKATDPFSAPVVHAEWLSTTSCNVDAPTSWSKPLFYYVRAFSQRDESTGGAYSAACSYSSKYGYEIRTHESSAFTVDICENAGSFVIFGSPRRFVVANDSDDNIVGTFDGVYLENSCPKANSTSHKLLVSGSANPTSKVRSYAFYFNATASSYSTFKTQWPLTVTYYFYQRGTQTFGVHPSTQEVAPSGGQYVLTVNASCVDKDWSVIASADWILPYRMSGAGPATLGYSVSRNDTGVRRAGYVKVNNNTVMVTQDPCTAPITAAGAYTIVFRSIASNANSAMQNILSMSSQSVDSGAVVALCKNKFSPPSGKRFAGWACSNGKRYDDGMLVFNLAQPGETVTMTAIWE